MLCGSSVLTDSKELSPNGMSGGNVQARPLIVSQSLETASDKILIDVNPKLEVLSATSGHQEGEEQSKENKGATGRQNVQTSVDCMTLLWRTAIEEEENARKKDPQAAQPHLDALRILKKRVLSVGLHFIVLFSISP